jgi:UDP-N-acetylmuramate: L-alanyl-gamma-D-glutamyl-meso-diaminopimelate ligase
MRVHFISIGGAVMHNMALALHSMGYEVSGSDDEIFEPALSRLKDKGLLPETFGWDENRITPDIDFIILGMHARAENPELIKAKSLDLKIYSFPEYVYEHSKNKTRIVVGGSHGKTSTTAMIMHVLNHKNIEFDYLVGSQLEGFERMVKLSHAPVIVIEGDEYLTSALDLKPKFHWYKPHTAILTGIAWDHINVFPTYEFYVEQFKIFIDSIEPGGTLIYCNEDKDLVKLATQASCKALPYDVPEHTIENSTTTIHKNGVDYPLEVFGKHNLLNLQAAMMACKTIGVSEPDFWKAIFTFTGAAKRLEKIRDAKTLKIYRDFAHSPSKLKATVKAAIEQFDGFNIVGVFELHTFSSLNADFLKEYKDAMKGLNTAIVYYNSHVFELKKMKMLSPDFVSEQFGGVMVINDNAQLQETIQSSLKGKDVLLLMSSGNFDGMDMLSFGN